MILHETNYTAKYTTTYMSVRRGRAGKRFSGYGKPKRPCAAAVHEIKDRKLERDKGRHYIMAELFTWDMSPL